MTLEIDSTTTSSELLNLNSDFTKNLKLFATCVESLIENFNGKEEMSQMNKGISFLSMKNMLMIEYLTNLLQLVYMKLGGQKISGSACVLRLAEIRCIIEKTKSIEVKLKYQIDKLLKMALTVNTNEFDPLSFKANIDGFMAAGKEVDDDDDDKKETESDDDDDEDIIEDINEEDEEKTKAKPGVYKPPKLVPTYYDLDETPEERAKKQIDRLGRRVINSSVMKELENEYSGAPEEIRENYANIIGHESVEQRHKREYEEENFVRKPLTKKEMMHMKRLKQGTNLNTLTSFDDVRLLLDENINMEEILSENKQKKKLKKGKDKGGKKKGGGKKKRKIRYT